MKMLVGWWFFCYCCSCCYIECDYYRFSLWQWVVSFPPLLTGIALVKTGDQRVIFDTVQMPQLLKSCDLKWQSSVSILFHSGAQMCHGGSFINMTAKLLFCHFLGVTCHMIMTGCYFEWVHWKWLDPALREVLMKNKNPILAIQRSDNSRMSFKPHKLWLLVWGGRNHAGTPKYALI